MFSSTKPGLTVKKTVAATLIPAILLIFLLVSSCSQNGAVGNGTSNDNITSTVNEPGVSVLFDENTVVSLYEKAIQAVVEIQTISDDNSLSDPFETPPLRRQGSGFIIDGEGHIITNYHVVEGASEVRVILYDGHTVDAKVIGTAPQNDIALLEVNKDELSNTLPLPLGDSGKVKPGQMAIALGSPFGLNGSITVGIVSGLGRSISSTTQRLIIDVIQTDAAINPGNSGGPLLNSKGEVIGINTAIEPSSNGIGFVVPINTVKSLLPALIEGGEVRSPWLGITGLAIDEEFANSLDIAVDKGVYVISVVPGSPAEEAGLRGSSVDEQGQSASGGDIITAIDGRVVSGVEDIIAYLNGKKAGDTVSLSVYRDQQVLTIVVVLGEWPDQIS